MYEYYVQYPILTNVMLGAHNVKIETNEEAVENTKPRKPDLLIAWQNVPTEPHS